MSKLNVILIGALALPLSAQSRPTANGIAATVDSFARRIVESGLTPGLGVAVVMDGRTVLARGYGFSDITARLPASDHTLWYVASTSKSYTGFAVSLLATQGALDFSRPITELLPRARWPEGVEASRLTLANFLSHTHQLNDDAVVSSAAFTGEIPEAKWPEYLRFARPRNPPNLVYSNLGYNVAAMVIDALRPEGWRRYLDSAIYRPAGLTETYARVSGLDPRRIAMPHALSPDGGYRTLTFFKTDATMNSAGGHLATLKDLARWITVQMDSGMLDGRRVFPAAAVALSHRMIAPHTVETSKRFGIFDRTGWAAGWDIGSYEGEPMVSRFGGYSTYRSHLSFLPRRRIGVVAQVNGGAAPAADLIAGLAYDLEAGKPNARAVAEQRFQGLVTRLGAMKQQIATNESQRAARRQPMDRPLNDFAGTYRNEAMGTIRFELKGDHLEYRWGAVYGPADIFDGAKHILRIEVAGAAQTIEFHFSGPGPASSIESNGRKFERVP